MSHENLAVIRDQYAATNERDWARAMAHYDVDVELVVPEGSSSRAGTRVATLWAPGLEIGSAASIATAGST
jgi:hypothetical protein